MADAAISALTGVETSALASIRRRAVLSCAIGNFFELFDFTIYGYFAVAIAHAFYPSGSMFSTFATFGAAFLMRPVGAIVIGAYGDRMGRRAALVVTIGLMAAATGFTGLIPTSQSIGVWAPIVLVLCRLLQGFSTGGEWGGAASFMVEYAPEGRRGFYGRLQQVSTGFGQLLSISMALTLSALLDQQTLGEWGWRIPFIVGFLLAPVGYYLRSRVSESPVFERSAAKHEIAHSPVRLAFAEHHRAILTGFGVTIIWTAGTFIFLTFMLTFAQQTLGIDAKTASLSGALAAI